MQLEEICFIPDVHIPYHDKRAWKLLLKVVAARQPKRIYILGDFMDCMAVNGHGLKPSQRALRLIDEINDANKALDELQAVAPNAKTIYIFGNHEYRIQNYINDHAPALDGMADLTEYLGLWERGIKQVDYGDICKLDHIVMTHDVGKAGENAHRHARKKVHGNVIIGHTHRMAVEYEGSLNGPHFGAHFGWLGSHAAHSSYKDKVGQKVDSVLGFGWGFKDAKAKVVHVQAIPIISYKCVVGAQLYA
jgi:predicted phosphodiesterase